MLAVLLRHADALARPCRTSCRVICSRREGGQGGEIF